MKRITAALCVSILLLLIQSSFRNTDPDEELRAVIMKRAMLLSAQVHALHNAAIGYATGKTSLAVLRKQLLKTRNAYKGVEYIVEYYYPEHTKEYLNGPPLYHLDPYPYHEGTYYSMPAKVYVNSMPLDYLDKDHYRDEAKVIAPGGLQVLDELVFSEAVDAKRVMALAIALETKWEIIVQALSKRKYFRAFEITEAVRLELIRCFTLGITGFDTPGSLNALAEANATMGALREVIWPLLRQTNLAQRTEVLFSKSILYLSQNNHFDTFDRLTFLTAYINPLYKVIGDVHEQLHLKTSAVLSGKVASWNFYSSNIFSEDFLDPYYYTLLKKEKDNDTLRALGKKLFYDPRISHTGKMSCSSCHQPAMAFTDGVTKSFERNSPSLINAVYADRYFYDLRAFDLEDQANHVIKNHLEFDTDFPEILQKINADTAYVALFNSVFHKPVTRSQFSSALSSYVLSLRSFNSPFDQYVRGEKRTLPKQVKEGFNLFMGKAACGTCHYAPTFSGLVPPLYHESESEVLGVFQHPLQQLTDDDKGRVANHTFSEDVDIYRYSFKTVSVRNVAITAPYFHNGAYTSLNDVIDFYDHGGGLGMLTNQTLSTDSLHLLKSEKAALIAFLQSLTDSSAIRKFSR
ncbi:cytochrome c peroxidase [Chitinophaga sp. CF118]|uniref:cytochrome-c peroxidase n=1 Tax=Chitinophaga sp. CF118 TaxID=1884367 RepID=UPI0008F1E512|nr:cytochrome c peroxidase [Chitinophaga sp. CF118]SFD46507.1 cytochrome c peroxidase [Chitinophaga sp. CF118]